MLFIEIDGTEIEIEDPGSLDSWRGHLTELVESRLSGSYYEYFERIDEIDNKAFAEFYENLVTEYLKDKKEHPDTLWQHFYTDGLADYYSEHFVNPGYDLEFVDNEIRRLLQDIEDHDEISDEIKEGLKEMAEDIGLEACQKADKSTIWDAFGKLSCRFIYVKGLSNTDFISDYDVQGTNGLPDELEPTNGDLSFISMMGVSLTDYLTAQGVGYRDHNAIKRFSRIPSTYLNNEKIFFRKNGKEIDTKIAADVDFVTTMLEEGASNGGIPCWIGNINLKDLADCDPSLGFALHSGMVGIVDQSRGSGYIEGMPDGKYIFVDPGSSLIMERGYSADDIFGYRKSDFDAAVVKSGDIVLEKELAAINEVSNKDKAYDQSISRSL